MLSTGVPAQWGEKERKFRVIGRLKVPFVAVFFVVNSFLLPSVTTKAFWRHFFSHSFFPYLPPLFFCSFASPPLSLLLTSKPTLTSRKKRNEKSCLENPLFPSHFLTRNRSTRRVLIPAVAERELIFGSPCSQEEKEAKYWRRRGVPDVPKNHRRFSTIFKLYSSMLGKR